ncbi:hypothetical protein K7A41_00540 [Sphingobacterium sp. InxBP1]|uniref:hypothetical protein n=1 Tax=Sphingobacterium sp. InxBP1 TaxID=2870328 RepID=UPI002244F3FD|nr:hypothetical protein [Sphingobacterium sp. InxBP1]MCW8309708.1 hypothetical protein [Sphingobacterium sp. InxBP1]
MKIIHTILTLTLNLGISQMLMAQTNIFPANGSVGIGTTSPLVKLEVRGGNFLVKNLRNETGESVPMISQSLGFGDYTDFGTSINTVTENSGNNSYGLQFLTKESYLTKLEEKMRITAKGNVGIGTSSPNAKLAVNGNIVANEIKVKTDITVPDYVFEKDYRLPSLDEIEQYIKANKHLPEIPSAGRIAADGLDIAQMNLLLLKKIEEMTLHLIEQQKQIKELQSKVATNSKDY